MKAITILLLSFMDPSQIDCGLQIHVESFIQEAASRGVHLPAIRGLKIHFKSITGMGGYWDQADSTIWINSAYRFESRALLEIIVFHELGHAWLQRGHETERTSMMNAKPAIGLYRKYRKEFLDELFNQTPVFR